MVTVTKKGRKFYLYVLVLDELTGATVLKPADTVEEFEAALPEYRTEIDVEAEKMAGLK